VKYAFTTFSCPTATWADALRLAKQHGYDGIEPRAQQKHEHGVEVKASPVFRHTLAKPADSMGIAICCIATSCKFTTPADADHQLNIAGDHIDLAYDLQCPCIRVFPGLYAKEISREDAVTSLVNSLRELAPYAQQRNVKVCVETHDSICDAPTMADVMRQVDHPSIGVVWDVMHTQRQGKQSMTDAYALLKPWIGHVHVHDGLDTLDAIKMLPIGTGGFDHREVLRLLRDDNYQGFISGEWIQGCMDKDFFASHLESEIATLRKMEAELP
jgi:sugar phosphate isomerase/epimerase